MATLLGNRTTAGHTKLPGLRWAGSCAQSLLGSPSLPPAIPCGYWPIHHRVPLAGTNWVLPHITDPDESGASLREEPGCAFASPSCLAASPGSQSTRPSFQSLTNSPAPSSINRRHHQDPTELRERACISVSRFSPDLGVRLLLEEWREEPDSIPWAGQGPRSPRADQHCLSLALPPCSWDNSPDGFHTLRLLLWKSLGFYLSKVQLFNLKIARPSSFHRNSRRWAGNSQFLVLLYQKDETFSL